jgi:hypothetical protein
LLALAVWGLIAYARHRELGPSFRSALVIAEVVLIVQATLGVLLLIQGFAPRDWLHLVYGTLSTIAIPIVASYLTGTQGRRRTLIYGIAMLVVFGLATRAYMTGG